MEKEEKINYEAPSSIVIDVKTEGVICTSPVQSGNSIDGWGDGGTINDDLYM